MAKTWVKLYVDMLNDMKIGPLSVSLKWRFVELLLLAGELDQDGLLPPVSQMAWRLGRIGEGELVKSLESLGDAGVVCQQGDRWAVTNFSKRQAKIPDAERASQYRHRKRHEGVTARDGAGAEESSSSDFESLSGSDSESLEEGGLGGENAPPAGRPVTVNVFTVYEHEIGPLTQHIADELGEAEQVHGPEWVCRAIKIASEQNARSWAYVKAILSRWQKDGYGTGRKEQGEPPQASSAYVHSAFAEFTGGEQA